MPTDPHVPSPGLSGTLRAVLAADALLVGAGYLLGPPAWSSSGTLAVVRDLGVPIPVWGAVFLTVGALVGVGWQRVGYVLGLFTYGFWGACQVVTIADGQVEAWGTPWHTAALGALHGVGLWRNSTERALRP